MTRADALQPGDWIYPWPGFSTPVQIHAIRQIPSGSGQAVCILAADGHEIKRFPASAKVRTWSPPPDPNF